VGAAKGDRQADGRRAAGLKPLAKGRGALGPSRGHVGISGRFAEGTGGKMPPEPSGKMPDPVRLRRQEDGAVEVRSCAVKNRAVSNRNCVAAMRVESNGTRTTSP